MILTKAQIEKRIEAARLRVLIFNNTRLSLGVDDEKKNPFGCFHL